MKIISTYKTKFSNVVTLSILLSIYGYCASGYAKIDDTHFSSGSNIPIEKALPTHNPLTCDDLNGIWEGTYQEKTGLYGKSGPWPIVFNLYYDSKTHLFYGAANTPFVPSSVTPQGKINYVNQQRAHIIGICEGGHINQTLLYTQDKPHCGHYQTSSGRIIKNDELMLYLNYEFPMIDANFSVSLHKKSKESLLQSIPYQKLPQIESCH